MPGPVKRDEPHQQQRLRDLLKSNSLSEIATG